MKLSGRFVFLLPVLFFLGCPPDSVEQNRKMVEVAQEKIMRLDYLTIIRKDQTEFQLPRLDVGTGWIVFTEKNTFFVPKVVGSTYKSSDINGASWIGDWPMENRDAKSQ